jgi:hypothetical protein
MLDEAAVLVVEHRAEIAHVRWPWQGRLIGSPARHLFEK